MKTEFSPPYRGWKWKRYLLWCVIALLVGLAAQILFPAQFASKDPHKSAPVVQFKTVSATATPDMPCPDCIKEQKWAHLFYSGGTGRARKNIPYAKGFHRWFNLHAARAFHRVHPNHSFNKATAWRNFTRHDNCVAVSMVGSPSLPGCRTWKPYSHKMNKLLHDSAYWKERSRQQNVWTNRVIICGGSFIAQFWPFTRTISKAQQIAAATGRVQVGPGGLCLAGTMVMLN